PLAPPARIACHLSRNIGVRRSSSAQSASALEVAGSSWVGRVAAIRNLAGLRFSTGYRGSLDIVPDSQSRQVAHGGGSLPLRLHPDLGSHLRPSKRKWSHSKVVAF